MLFFLWGFSGGCGPLRCLLLERWQQHPCLSAASPIKTKNEFICWPSSSRPTSEWYRDVRSFVSGSRLWGRSNMNHSTTALVCSGMYMYIYTSFRGFFHLPSMDMELCFSTIRESQAYISEAHHRSVHLLHLASDFKIYIISVECWRYEANNVLRFCCWCSLTSFFKSDRYLCNLKLRHRF